jgi:hypothetical protein
MLETALFPRKLAYIFKIFVILFMLDPGPNPVPVPLKQKFAVPIPAPVPHHCKSEYKNILREAE